MKLSPTRAVAWKQGSGVIRLIHGREGFCYLSAISGGLRGAGEAVRVALEQDGWWYLSGKAAVPLEAMAAVVPWPCASRAAGGDFLRVAPRRRTSEDDPQERRLLLADRNRRRISRSVASEWKL
jgi:hypothetical protein